MVATTRSIFSLYVALLLAGTTGVPSPVLAQDPALPWLESIGGTGGLSGIYAISAEADVTVSDGLAYSVSTLFLDAQRMVFRRVYVDRTVTQGVEGRYVWTYDGKTEVEAPSFVGEIVSGHQFHAQILLFDRLHGRLAEPQVAQFAGKACLAVEGQGDASGWRFYYERSGHPLGMEMAREEDANIVFEFGDWRPVARVSLPFTVSIDDGDRKFQYQYSRVALNDGSLERFRAPESVLTDEQKLLRLHRIAMDGHLFERSTDLKALPADSMVIVSDGDVYVLDSDGSDSMIDSIMESRRYTVYDDLIRPMVMISQDGTLGWVIAQVSAKGWRLDAEGAPRDSLSFVSAWVELYSKVEGRWRLTGNVSGFRPGRR